MTWQFDIENIAGIRSGTASVEPGINVVRASNWQGKSSLIKAIETAMGTAFPLTEGADHGRVELTTDDDTLVVELTRENGDVARRGDGYLSNERDRVYADLFAFLDDDNDVRRAVRNGENLEEILTRPLDFERIDERIADLRQERDQVKAELGRARTAANRLGSVQERVTSVESELEELRSTRDGLTTDEGTTESASKRDELSDVRAERDRFADQEEQLESTIANTRDRLEERREALEQLDVPQKGDFESDIADARDRLGDIEQDVELLQSLYNANKRVLDSGRVELLTEIEHGLVDDSITCWVCGDAVDRQAVEAQLASIAERLSDRREAAEEYRAEVQAIETKREAIREKRRRKEDLEAELDDLRATLADREESLESVRQRLEDVTGRIEELQGVVEAADDQLTDIESEIKYKVAELNDVRDELADVEQRAEQRDRLEDELEAITEEIEALQTRKERVKAETLESFDDAIQALVDRLEPGFETARLTSNFDLVVAREGREANLDALSEGEVELLGVVAAIAGFDAFEVGDSVPVILLDSVGDLTSENLEPLVRYLAGRTTHLVTTAYPEQDLSEDHLIEPTDWSVVSSDITHEVPP